MTDRSINSHSTDPDGTGDGGDHGAPNVLFIICDQLRADHLGFAGNSVVRTPNIDRLAARSVVFDNAYVSNPVCMPNRSTIMTGKMPSAHGVIFNDRSLEPDLTTFVGELRDHGWRTALIGKSHLQHGLSRDSVTDLGRPPGRSDPFQEGWNTLEHCERYWAGETIDPVDFYGFDHMEITLGHGSYSGGHHYQWALERGATHEQLLAGVDPDADIPGRSAHWWQIHPAPFAEELYSTHFVTDRTIAFIEACEAADESWLAWCSFPDPHHPLSPPDPWFSAHDPADMALPDTFGDTGEDWAPHLSRIQQLAPSSDGDRYVAPFGPDEVQCREAIAATYGMIEMIDHGVGRILDRLDELGATDDTIVVFTSDHGDMMGDHGLIMKGYMHFMGTLRVPMTVHAPGADPGRIAALASSIDLPTTLLTLCGVTPFQGMQGRSLVPLMSGEASSVRDRVLVEDDFPAGEIRPQIPLRTRTVLADRYKFTKDSNGNEMLFDLDADPHELHNLASEGRDPAARALMMEALAESLMEADDMTRLEPVPL